MKYLNKVNQLDGKQWLRNAVNFWRFESYDINMIIDRFVSFCYKDRTESGMIINCKQDVLIKSDFSFTHIKSFDDVELAVKVILNGEYNSYHIVFSESELVDNILIAPGLVQKLVRSGIEYRGRIIIQILDVNKVFFSFMFLNRGTKEHDANIQRLSASNLSEPIIIESKSKIDSIGLKHPAPFSYLDIKKLCNFETIENKIILDPFLGVGSTIIGTYENNINIGIELNKEYIDLIYDRIELLDLSKKALSSSQIIHGDCLDIVPKLNSTFDVVITSPPYFNILKNKTSGVRTDESQTRQGIVYYSDCSKDFGNILIYEDYLLAMKKLFSEILLKISNYGKVYLIISDFTVNKKEMDVHSDFILLMENAGYKYTGTHYILQNQKAIYPFGYPHKIVLNHIYQYIMKFEVK